MVVLHCHFGAARSCVRHAAAEPMFEHETGVHNTATLRTDVYTVHGPTSSRFDWLTRMFVNIAAARFAFQRQPHALSLTDAIESFSAV